jgi:DNA repair ATPase RecN
MLKFELEILSGVKEEYENYIERNKELYKETKLYFKYISYRNRLANKELYYKRVVEDFNYNEKTYPCRLVNYKFSDMAEMCSEKGMIIEEEINFINEKIKKIKYDVFILNTIDAYLKEIPKLKLKIEEIRNKIEAIEKGFVIIE